MNQMFNVLLFILSEQIDFRSIVIHLQLLFEFHSLNINSTII